MADEIPLGSNQHDAQESGKANDEETLGDADEGRDGDAP